MKYDGYVIILALFAIILLLILVNINLSEIYEFIK